MLRRFGALARRPVVVAPRGEFAPRRTRDKSLDARTSLRSGAALGLFRCSKASYGKPRASEEARDIGAMQWGSMRKLCKSNVGPAQRRMSERGGHRDIVRNADDSTFILFFSRHHAAEESPSRDRRTARTRGRRSISDRRALLMMRSTGSRCRNSY